MNTLHFIWSNVFFFSVSYFVEKKQQQQQNRHGKEKLSLWIFFDLTLADYNKLRQGLVNKSKYKVKKKITYIASIILGVLNA